MDKSVWDIQEYIIPAAHTRHYARGVQDNRNPYLKLAVKRLAPRKNPSPKAGDVTLLMIHGTGCSKESLEPFLEDVVGHSDLSRLRAVWTVDAPYNGKSYRLNEHVIGDEISWNDFARDIWQMINYFQLEMPPPLVGIGQSLGCYQLLTLSLWHPRLFSGLVMCEPGIGPVEGFVWPRPAKYQPLVLAARRKDGWPSREAARSAFSKSPYYRSLDSRVLEKIFEHELIDKEEDTACGRKSVVRLTTPVPMDTALWLRAEPPLKGYPRAADSNVPPQHADLSLPGFIRPESWELRPKLPMVNPRTIFIWAEHSEIKADRPALTNSIGTGYLGGGGRRQGQIEEVEIKDTNHPVMLEKPTECAEAVVPWLNRMIRQWDIEAEEAKKQPAFDNSKVPPELLERIDEAVKRAKL